jgi:hypothetical protein
MRLSDEERKILIAAREHVGSRARRGLEVALVLGLVLGLLGCAIIVAGTVPELSGGPSERHGALKDIGVVGILAGYFASVFTFGWQLRRFRTHAYSLIQKLSQPVDSR